MFLSPLFPSHSPLKMVLKRCNKCGWEATCKRGEVVGFCVDTDEMPYDACLRCIRLFFRDSPEIGEMISLDPSIKHANADAGLAQEKSL